MVKRVLGLDISSACIGYGVLEIDEQNNIKYIDSGYYKPIQNDNVIIRLSTTRDKLKEIFEKYKPDYIGIENIISFMKGKSSANTIIRLTEFNRMTCLFANDYLNRPPELFNVLSIRHGIKTNKILPQKEAIPDLVANHLGIIFPYEYGRKGKLKVENFDRADGICVSLYYAFLLTGKIKKKIKKD